MPGVVPAATVKVMLVLLPAENGLVVYPTVTPVGRPLADNVMEPVNPPVTALLMVVDPLLPGLIERELGDAEMVKPAGGGPVSAVMRVAVGLPQPVTRSNPATAE